MTTLEFLYNRSIKYFSVQKVAIWLLEIVWLSSGAVQAYPIYGTNYGASGGHVTQLTRPPANGDSWTLGGASFYGVWFYYFLYL